MLGRQDRDQPELFMTGSIRQLVPEGHVLAGADRLLDLGWLRAEVAELSCADNGRPGIDPEHGQRHSRKTGRFRKVCVTDPDASPDASMATSGRNRRLEPACKQHAAVDEVCGVVLDVEATTGEVIEGGELMPALGRVEAAIGGHVAAVTADAGYA